MKLIAVILITLLSFGATAQMPTTDSLAKEFIACIKTNDAARFTRLYPDKETMKVILNAMNQKSGGNSIDSAAMDMVLANMGNEFKGMFQKMITRVKTKIKDPSKIEFKSYKPSQYRNEEESGEKIHSGVVTIMFAGKQYLLGVDEILEYKNVFYGMELKTIKPAVAVVPAKKPVKKV
jgi:hypothetical protein